jgi:hypothetical protein
MFKKGRKTEIFSKKMGGEGIAGGTMESTDPWGTSRSKEMLRRPCGTDTVTDEMERMAGDGETTTTAANFWMVGRCVQYRKGDDPSVGA